MPRLARLAMLLALAATPAPTFAGPPGTPQAARADLAGPWTGAIEVGGVTLGITVVFGDGASGLSATIDIPQQGAHGLQLRAVRRQGAAVHFELPAGPGLAVFDGTRDGDTIAGTFTQGAASGTFTLARATPAPPAADDAPPPYRQEDVTFTNGNVTLAGTLTLPEGRGPFPALVMITGSGPQNRDEELFGFKPFKVLADAFARAGVATLRYDDRGVGGSSGADSNPTTEDFAGDALAGVSLLAGRPDIARARVGLLGHSEGAVVAAIAAARSRSVAFIVLMAGTAVPGDMVLRQQALDLARAQGADDDALARIGDAHRRMTDAIAGGADRETLGRAVRALAAAQIAALPEARRRAIPDLDAYLDTVVKQQLPGIESRWMKFFLSFDPATALSQVRVPVLALFGGKDMQVPPAMNRPPLDAALARAGDTRVTVKVYPEANHLFLRAVTGSPAEYATLEKVFVPPFVEDVTAWVLGVTK